MNILATRFDPNVGNFLKRRKLLREFIEVAETRSYVFESFPDETSRLTRVLHPREVGKLFSNGSRVRHLIRVSVADFDGAVNYAGLGDKAGTEIDVTLRGKWKIANAREFLNSYALNQLRLSDCVSLLDFERKLTELLRTRIVDEIRGHEYEDLVGKDALPLSWWNSKLGQWESLGGADFLATDEVNYESATADRQKELSAQQELNEWEEARADEEKRHLMAQRQRAAELEKKQDELEADEQVSREKRERELKELRHQSELSDLEAQQGLERRQLQFDKEKAEKESEIYRIRNQLPEAEKILEDARRREARVEEMLQRLLEAQEELAWKLDGGVLSPQTADLLGQSESHHRLSGIFLENEAEHGSIVLEMVELKTRDIGTRSAETLSIGRALNFAFKSRVSGFATVINVGTSKKVYLHSPNVHVGANDCRVEAGRKYSVPGDLIPGLEENRLSYIENGPPGWEQMVVVVSDEPLVRDSDIEESESGNPFVRIDAEEWLERLRGLSPGSWRSGTLGFKVLDR